MGVTGAGFCDIHVHLDAEAGRVVAERVAVFPADLYGEEVGQYSAGLAWHLLDADVGGCHAE